MYLILSHYDAVDVHANKYAPASRNVTSFHNIFIDSIEVDRRGGNTRIIFHAVQHFTLTSSSASADATISAVGITDLKQAVVPSISATEEVKVADGLVIVRQLQQYFERVRSRKLVGFDVLLIDTYGELLNNNVVQLLFRWCRKIIIKFCVSVDQFVEIRAPATESVIMQLKSAIVTCFGGPAPYGHWSATDRAIAVRFFWAVFV